MLGRMRRQIDVKRGAFAHFTFHAQEAMMAFDDGHDRGQAKTGAFPQFFGGEKRLKNAVCHLRRHACAIVLHLNVKVLPGFRTGNH